MSRVLSVASLCAGLVAALPGAASAQPVTTSGAVVPWRDAAPGPLSRQTAPGTTGSSLTPAALSLVMPGAGQHVLGQGRKWVYAALEVAGWAVFLERRSAGGEYRDRYRDFAWNVGRIQSGPRVDGDFDYYETLSRWVASGAYDADAVSAGVQPETDPTTYNGSIWTRATQIFIPGGGPVPPTDPGYRSALAYYDELAYHTAFLWDWTAVPEGRQELGDLIEESDSRFRQATTALGVVIANHLISAADAYLAARGRSAPATLDLVPAVRAGQSGWSAVVSVPVGR